jgi:hypothetical protein
MQNCADETCNSSNDRSRNTKRYQYTYHVSILIIDTKIAGGFEVGYVESGQNANNYWTRKKSDQCQCTGFPEEGSIGHEQNKREEYKKPNVENYAAHI